MTWTITVCFRITQNNNIHCLHLVTRLPSNHFQELHSSTTIYHLTWQQVCNQAPISTKDCQGMTHHGNDMKSPNVIMVDLKCSPLHSSHNKGYHLHVHCTYFRYCRNRLSSVADIVQLYSSITSVWSHREPTQCCQCNESSLLQSCGKPIFQGYWTWCHFQSCPMINIILLIRAMIHQTWVVQKAKLKPGWRKPNSHRRTLP